MTAQKSIGIKVVSTTGANVADFWSNTEKNSGLELSIKMIKNGGVDSFDFNLANNFDDPLFAGMICRFYIDGVHVESGYVDKIPYYDSSGSIVKFSGLGFYHKLKTIVINESYSGASLFYIFDDILTKYLGDDLQVYYKPQNINVPTINGIDIDFNDKDLYKAIDTLMQIANVDYDNNQYRFFVDKDQIFNIELLSQDTLDNYFEGYDYQYPKVDNVSNKIVNKLIAYRTKAAAPKETEYVNTYSDQNSISLNGEFAEKITLPDYVDTATIEKICNGIIARFGHPIDRIQVSNFETLKPLDFGKYSITNRRTKHFETVGRFEDLSGWDMSGLAHTTYSVSHDEVFTNRTSLKLMLTNGSSGEFFRKVFDTPIYFPTLFRGYFYLTDANSLFTVAISDTFGNTIYKKIGTNGEPRGRWLKMTVEIDMLYDRRFLTVDKSTTEHGCLKVSRGQGDDACLVAQKLVRFGVLNINKIVFEMNSDADTVFYLDEIAVEAVAYKSRQLFLEEQKIHFSNARVADLTFGDVPDSLVKEITKKTAAGAVALNVFAKQ